MSRFDCVYGVHSNLLMLSLKKNNNLLHNLPLFHINEWDFITFLVFIIQGCSKTVQTYETYIFISNKNNLFSNKTHLFYLHKCSVSDEKSDSFFIL